MDAVHSGLKIAAAGARVIIFFEFILFYLFNKTFKKVSAKNVVLGPSPVRTAQLVAR